MADHLPRPRPSRALRDGVFQRSGGCSQRDRCGVEIRIDPSHVVHLRAHAQEGALPQANLEAWCVHCNLTFGVQDVRDYILAARQVEIRPGPEVERKGKEGVVVTYQSLGTDTVAIHRRGADLARTLYVLDEVHRVGESNDTGDRPGWAR